MIQNLELQLTDWKKLEIIERKHSTYMNILTLSNVISIKYSYYDMKIILFVGFLVIVLVLSMNIIEGNTNNTENVPRMNTQLEKLNELKNKMPEGDRTTLSLNDLMSKYEYRDYKNTIRDVIRENSKNTAPGRRVNGGKKIQEAIDNLTRRRDYVRDKK